MGEYAKEYLKNYSKNYTLVEGIPTSPFGITLAKRCKWCYNIMFSIPKPSWKDNSDYIESKKKGVMRQTFCSQDCKDEYRDWSYVRSLTNRIEKRKLASGIKKTGVIMDRKEYYKKYFQEHRDKKRQQSKLIMRRYRIKIRLNK